MFHPIQRSLESGVALSKGCRDALDDLWLLWGKWRSIDGNKTADLLPSEEDLRSACCDALGNNLVMGSLLPTFQALQNHDKLNTVLKEVQNSQGRCCCSDSTYDNFAEFQLKFAVGDAYIERGGKAYVTKLLKSNSKALKADNVIRVQYSHGIKADTARDLIDAAKEAEDAFGVQIRFLASFRGTNASNGLAKLQELERAYERAADLEDWVVGVDVMGNEVTRDYMPFKLPQFREFICKHRLGVHIHLGEAVNPDLPLAQRYHTMFEGLDAAWLALDDPLKLKVRFGHGLYLKQLVQDLRDHKVAVPSDMDSTAFQGTQKQLADNISKLLQHNRFALEVCLNSNLLLIRGSFDERKTFLAEFVDWLLLEKINFCFGTDDPGIHSDVPYFSEVIRVCSCPQLFWKQGRAAWYCEWVALHLSHELNLDHVTAARVRSVNAAFRPSI